MLAAGFMLDPVVSCPTGEGYRRLRGLMSGLVPVLAWLAVVLLAGAVLAVAVRGTFSELPQLPDLPQLQQLPVPAEVHPPLLP
jgi:hypothetical protein